MTILAVATAISAQPVWAQEPAPEIYALPEITLTANQTEEEIARTGATVEVVDRAEIERAGNVRAVEYLSTLPGISASGNGGFGTITNLRLRGLGGQYVKVLYDGIDISDPSDTQIKLNWGGLLAGNLSRIEVLKGPQSALYGSDAIAGVISLYTAPTDAPGTHQQAQIEYGSYATTNARYGIVHNGETGSLAFSVQHLETDGFSVADENDGNTEEDGARSTLASLKADYQLTERVTIGAAAFWQETDVQTDSDFPFLTDNADSSHSIRRGARLYGNYEGDLTIQSLSVQKSQTERAEVYGDFSYPFKGSRTELAYDGSAGFGDASVLAWGASHSDEAYDEEGGEGGYITNSLYAEYRRALTPDLDLALSARRDHNSQFGGETTGRIAMSWRPAPGWTIRAQAGTGFRAPSPYELGNPFAGNPDLHPETSTGYDAGIERQWDNGAAWRVGLFDSKIEDLIINDASTGYVYQQTDGTSRSRGVEIAGTTPLTDRLTLSGNFTFTDTEGADGQPLPRVPRQALNLRLEGQITERADFSLTLQHLAGIVDAGEELPSFAVVGASAEYDLSNEATAYLRIENLLDKEYQLIRGYGTSDRAVYAGIRADF
nr:TonB-dependent receptor [Paracoccus marinaquae]